VRPEGGKQSGGVGALATMSAAFCSASGICSVSCEWSGERDPAGRPGYHHRSQVCVARAPVGVSPQVQFLRRLGLPTWEQYFRDLAVFGCNAIELIPPRSDDDANSPHFPRPPMEMMQGMSGWLMRMASMFGSGIRPWTRTMPMRRPSSPPCASGARYFPN